VNVEVAPVAAFHKHDVEVLQERLRRHVRLQQ
jgi:hypothetical protein